jgi:hypothetical protein
MGRGVGVGAAVGVAGVQAVRRKTMMIFVMNKARFKITSGSGEWESQNYQTQRASG